ncbi:TerB family tellurite resistance protein, partial [Corallococcus exiguus]|uniref:TerB family tellurite resistance protein n=1 Tax=Corallococcus exiguus TaxID=83462 RepID=UPI00215225D5
MAGLLIGGPWAIVLALILGTALGHYFDEQHGAPPDFPEILSDFPATFELPPEQPPLTQGPGEFPIVQAPDEDPLDRDITALFVDVARADGDMRREEVREVRRYFEEVLRADAHTVQAVRRYLKDFLSRPASLDRATLEYGVKVGLIFCLAREFDHKLNSIIVEKAIKYRSRGV